MANETEVLPYSDTSSDEPASGAAHRVNLVLTPGRPMDKNFLEELHWRGLLYQTTADDELREHLATPGRVSYCGFV